MKTKKQNTVAFVAEVKKELDQASWDYQACDSRAGYEDCDKAIRFLESQKFSTKIVSEKLLQVWPDLIYNLRTDYKFRKHRDISIAKYAAAMIANLAAYERIARYTARGWRVDGLNSKKWNINETVSFTIR